MYKNRASEKNSSQLRQIQFTVQQKIIVTKWLIRLAKASKVCCTGRQVSPQVDDSIAKKLFFYF